MKVNVVVSGFDCGKFWNVQSLSIVIWMDQEFRPCNHSDSTGVTAELLAPAAELLEQQAEEDTAEERV